MPVIIIMPENGIEMKLFYFANTIKLRVIWLGWENSYSHFYKTESLDRYIQCSNEKQHS